MPDATSAFLNKPLRSLEQFAEQQQRRLDEQKYLDAILALENLYWAVENNIGGENLWRMRNELRAAADQIRRAKGL